VGQPESNWLGICLLFVGIFSFSFDYNSMVKALLGWRRTGGAGWFCAQLLFWNCVGRYCRRFHTQEDDTKQAIVQARIVAMRTSILCALLLLAFTSSAQNSHPTTKVRVPDAATALSIAEPALIKVYGKRQIDYERPLTATLDDGIWSVYGTLCCPDPKGQRTCDGRCVGGVAVLKLRQSDGKILSISHTK
jgi:NTF2 fold immunity protein